MRKTLFESFIHGPLTEPAPKPDEAGLAELAQAVNRAARARLGRSLSIRHVDAGSCNGCELEIHALSNAFYDLERFGLRFVASPRHADVLTVTGPVTKNMREALLRTYNAMPDPKWVVAIGTCAVDGGLFSGSYAVDGGVKDVAPVTSLNTVTISLAPSAALVTFCEISLVAALCCCTDAATAAVYSSISCMRWAIRPIASTALSVEFCTSMIWLEISSVAFAVCTASDFTSAATTAKPRPASPARAASMVALSASRLV